MISISLEHLEDFLNNLTDKSRTNVLPALLKAQDLFNYIPEEATNLIAEKLKVPPIQVYNLIDFYSLLHKEPMPPLHVQVCTSPVCSSRGSQKIIEVLKTKKDQQRLYVEAVHCLGLCTNPPSVLVNGKQICQVNDQKIDQLLAGEGALPVNTGISDNPVLTKRFDSNEGETLSLYKKSGGFKGLAKALKLDKESIVEMVKNSGLLGRGGAAFPTGLKMESTAKGNRKEVYVICNADESEPGTFKDRILLNRDPFSVLEGMIITAYAEGSHKGYIYIRGEYKEEQKRFRNVIESAKKEGFLGTNIMGKDFSFNVEVRSGAGAYICGEETALFESIEGKRGFPRNKPPYPVDHGLFNQPTDINNVETFSYISHILADESLSGTRLFCLSGDVERPGLYELPFGTPLNEVIETWGGGIKEDKSIGHIILGGASGSFVPKEHYNIPLDNQSLKKAGLTMGSGVIMVFDESRKMLPLLRDITSFFNHESCGKCYPCRMGTRFQYDIISRICQEGPSFGDLEKLEDIGHTMKDASLCGLGQTAASALLSAIKLEPELFTKEVNP